MNRKQLHGELRALRRLRALCRVVLKTVPLNLFRPEVREFYTVLETAERLGPPLRRTPFAQGKPEYFHSEYGIDSLKRRRKSARK